MQEKSSVERYSLHMSEENIFPSTLKYGKIEVVRMAVILEIDVFINTNIKVQTLCKLCFGLQLISKLMRKPSYHLSTAKGINILAAKIEKMKKIYLV